MLLPLSFGHSMHDCVSEWTRAHAEGGGRGELNLEMS